MTIALDLDLLNELLDNQKKLENQNLFDDPIDFGSFDSNILDDEEIIPLSKSSSKQDYSTDSDDDLYLGKSRSTISMVLPIVFMLMIMAFCGYIYLQN